MRSSFYIVKPVDKKNEEYVNMDNVESIYTQDNGKLRIMFVSGRELIVEPKKFEPSLGVLFD